MKFAYKENDCVDGNGEWDSCCGCIFERSTGTRIWPCDLIPRIKCYGPTIFVHSNNLSGVFKV